MNQNEIAQYLGQLGELMTGLIKNKIEENSVYTDKLYISTRYEHSNFAVYLFNGDIANTVCKLWPIKELVEICNNKVKREIIIDNITKELIKKSKAKKCDKIIYI